MIRINDILSPSINKLVRVSLLDPFVTDHIIKYLFHKWWYEAQALTKIFILGSYQNFISYSMIIIMLDYPSLLSV